MDKNAKAGKPESDYSDDDDVDGGNEVIPFTDSEDEATVAKKPAAEPTVPKSYLDYAYYCVYFLFWATLWAIAIQLQFGIVYLLLSGIFGIYFNTRTGRRSRKEVSAYSVFNKNCHAIDGTLKGEQFDQEIRYGPVSVGRWWHI